MIPQTCETLITCFSDEGDFYLKLNCYHANILHMNRHSQLFSISADNFWISLPLQNFKGPTLRKKVNSIFPSEKRRRSEEKTVYILFRNKRSISYTRPLTSSTNYSNQIIMKDDILKIWFKMHRGLTLNFAIILKGPSIHNFLCIVNYWRNEVHGCTD